MTAATEFEILPNSPYSPDSVPSELYLFPKPKSSLCGTQHRSDKCVIEAVNEYLGDQEKAIYFEEIRKLEQRWAKYIALNGDYIEK